MLSPAKARKTAVTGNKEDVGRVGASRGNKRHELA